MMWNTKPSNVIPTATAAIGSRTSAVAFAPLTEGIEFAHRPIAKARMTVVPRAVRVPAPS
jgi:hypothetical protein